MNLLRLRRLPRTLLIALGEVMLIVVRANYLMQNLGSMNLLLEGRLQLPLVVDGLRSVRKAVSDLPLSCNVLHRSNRTAILAVKMHVALIVDKAR